MGGRKGGRKKTGFKKDSQTHIIPRPPSMSVAELRLDPKALPPKPALLLPPVTHLKGRKGSRPFPGGPRGQNRDRGHRWGGNCCNNQNYPTVSGRPQKGASSCKSWLLGTVRGIQEVPITLRVCAMWKQHGSLACLGLTLPLTCPWCGKEGTLSLGRREPSLEAAC